MKRYINVPIRTDATGRYCDAHCKSFRRYATGEYNCITGTWYVVLCVTSDGVLRCRACLNAEVKP